MGIIDRDYWREPDGKRSVHAHRPPASALFPWAVGTCIVAVLSLAVLAPLHWFPAWLAQHIAKARQGTSLGGQAIEKPRPAAGAGQSAVAPAPARLAQVTATPRQVAAPQPQPRALQQSSEDPFRKPGTIYRCKSYSGGLFWSDTHCSRHNALIDRIATVPVGLPFQQQVDIASGEANRLTQQLEGERREGTRAALCAALTNEREVIWKRSGSGAGYVPLDVLGRDQTRWRQIDAQLNANGCRR